MTNNCSRSCSGEAGILRIFLIGESFGRIGHAEQARNKTRELLRKSKSATDLRGLHKDFIHVDWRNPWPGFFLTARSEPRASWRNGVGAELRAAEFPRQRP